MEMERHHIQSNVKVAVRVRPLSFKEKSQGDQSIINSSHNTITMSKNSKQFNFDQVFSSESHQQDIFESIAKALVLRCFEGYNSTILAYGQTGSGKTYTMGTTGLSGLPNEQLGMVPRVIYFIFEQLGSRTDVTLRISYLEIHNEQIIDLLDTSKQYGVLQIREEKDQSISIPGLSEEVVKNPKQMIACLDRGGLNRTTATTNMNERSSRSHAIFTVHFEIAQPEDESNTTQGSFITAKFHFVDLAGSERLKKTQAVGKVMEEGISINQSLLVLGNVISLLSQKCRQQGSNTRVHIPYRESKLTRLLQDSLGGNANTYMVACVSPAESNFEETLNSLKYASRAREIENKPTINRDPQSAMIQMFKDQIKDLQQELEGSRSLLKENNINYVAVKKTSMASNQSHSNTNNNNLIDDESLKRIKMSVMFYEKQVLQLQAESNATKKTLSETEISMYQIRRQRDQINVELQVAHQILRENGLQLPIQDQPKQSSQFEEYEKEQDHLRRLLLERDRYSSQLQLEYDQLLKDQQRDQNMLFDKMDMIDKLKKSFMMMKKKNSELELKYNLLRQQDARIVEEIEQSQSSDDVDGDNQTNIIQEEDQDEDFLIKQRKDMFESAQRTCETELEMVSQEILKKESLFESMVMNNHELKTVLAEDMKREYYQQIHFLELEKQTIQQQHDQLLSKVQLLNSSDQSDRNQVQQLKTKVQQMETKITEMKTKDNHQKVMTRKMEEQDKQLFDLKSFIERMKRQKTDLQKKLKDEGEKFIRFKDDRYKDLMLVRKQKVTYEAQNRKLRNEKQRMEQLLLKKDTELIKHRQDTKLSQKKLINGKNTRNPKIDEIDQHISQVFEQTMRGRAADRQLQKEVDKINHTLQQIGNEERKMFQMEVRKEQLFYDINKLSDEQSYDAQQKVLTKQQELSQVHMELIDVNLARENMNEAADYQRRKINELRDVLRQANHYTMAYLDTQQGVPGPILKVLKYTMENWAEQQLNSQELQVQCESFQAQMSVLSHQADMIQSENVQSRSRIAQLEQELSSFREDELFQNNDCYSPGGKKPKQPLINLDQEDLRKQLKDQKRKFLSLEIEYRNSKVNQEYYKNLLVRYQTLHKKDKYIGLNKSDNFQSSWSTSNNIPIDPPFLQQTKSDQQAPQAILSSINNFQLMRDKRKQDQHRIKISSMTMNGSFSQQEQQQQKPVHRQTPSGQKFSNHKAKLNDTSSKIIAKKNVADFSLVVESIDAWISSDQEIVHNMSTEFESLQTADLKWELVKSFQAHEKAIQSCSSHESVLYSTAYNQFRVWNLDAQTLIHSIELSGYVRAACFWEEKKSIAVAHSNLVQLFDQNSLIPIATLKCADDVRVLTKHGPYLVAGGKGTQTSGALTIWDCRMTARPIQEFDKGQEVFSVFTCPKTNYLYWGTRTHNVKYVSQNYQQSGQLDPPHYDRVTGLGGVNQWIVSCSAGKDMRMWDQQTSQPGKLNSDIHKDVITTMTIDQDLSIIYTGSKDGQMKAIKIIGDKFIQLNDINASTQQINSISTIRNSNLVVSGGADKLLKIWRPSSQTTELIRHYTQSVSEFQIDEEQFTS